MIQSGQGNVHGTIPAASRGQWNTETSHGAGMSRLPSHDSVGAHSQRTTSSAANSYEQTRSARMYPNISQMSFHISSARSDITCRSASPDNSTFYTPIQQTDLQTFDQFPYPGGDDYSRNQSSFHRDSITDLPSNVSLTSGPSYSMFAATNEDTFHIPVTQSAMIYGSHTINDSPMWDGTAFPDSQRSSPTLDEWTLPGPQLDSTTNSPLNYSPSLEDLSPKYVQDLPEFADFPPYTTSDRTLRKPVGPRSKINGDVTAARHPRLNGTSEASEESFRFVGRSSLEADNTARDHALYQNVTVQADGLYHCPWEGKEGCQHKPEKLKCNYEYDFFLSPS